MKIIVNVCLCCPAQRNFQIQLCPLLLVMKVWKWFFDEDCMVKFAFVILYKVFQSNFVIFFLPWNSKIHFWWVNVVSVCLCYPVQTCNFFASPTLSATNILKFLCYLLIAMKLFWNHLIWNTNEFLLWQHQHAVWMFNSFCRVHLCFSWLFKLNDCVLKVSLKFTYFAGALLDTVLNSEIFTWVLSHK